MLKGIALSVLASISFGVLYFYTQLLGALDSQQIFGWRILATIPCLTVFLWLIGDLSLIHKVWQRLTANPWLILGLALTSALSSVQLWLFLWGPVHGRGLQVSLGYFLLPLILVLAGCLIYKEKLSKFQAVAVCFALFGVGFQFWQHGSMAWETLVVAAGYSLYFILRKKLQTEHLGGFFWDLILCLPVAVYFIVMGEGSLQYFVQQPSLALIVLGLGVLSAIGLGSYILASRQLPLILFGLLSYLEPVLLALAALIMGESIAENEWVTYIAIWTAVAILVLEGALHLYRQQHNRKNLLRNVERVQHRLKDDA
ncbi:EamA family transporter RarD [Acinetobacter larvae]|uniref:Permease n=1 Tax=Acinetobacter larvae TaxID=1789224 RepID=A0A1B2M0B4_9GAMM|nr:EamA family transporter RarD [Acinetobacter larvae]AOA58637.1 permease [Acinetobacter larvae]